MTTYSSNLHDYLIKLDNLDEYLICELKYNEIVWKSKITLDDLTSNMINLQKLMTIIKLNKEKIQPNYNIVLDLITNPKTNSSHLVMTIEFSNEFIDFTEKIVFTQTNITDEVKEQKLNQIIISQKREIDVMKKKIEELENRPLIGYIKSIERLYGDLSTFLQNIKNKTLDEKLLQHLTRNNYQKWDIYNKCGHMHNFHSLEYNIYSFLINNNLDEIKIFFGGINISYNTTTTDSNTLYKFWLFSFNFQTFGQKFEQDIMMAPRLKSEHNEQNAYDFYQFEKFFGYFIETYYFLKYCKVKKLTIECTGDDFGNPHSIFLFNWIVNNFSSTNVFDEIEFLNNLPLDNFMNSGIRTKKIKIVYDKSFNDNALKLHCNTNGIQFEYL